MSPITLWGRSFTDKTARNFACCCPNYLFVSFSKLDISCRHPHPATHSDRHPIQWRTRDFICEHEKENIKWYRFNFGTDIGLACHPHLDHNDNSGRLEVATGIKKCSNFPFGHSDPHSGRNWKTWKSNWSEWRRKHFFFIYSLLLSYYSHCAINNCQRPSASGVGFASRIPSHFVMWGQRRIDGYYNWGRFGQVNRLLFIYTSSSMNVNNLIRLHVQS